MQDFLDELETRLRAEAIAQAPQVAPARRRRGPLALGGLSATLAAVAAAFALTSTSTADLAILTTPTTDASGIRDQTPRLVREGVDFSEAHTFGTPFGPGYALVNDAKQTICLTIPSGDPEADRAGTCGRIADVERRGLMVSISGDTASDPDATSLSAFLLPDDAEEVTLTVRGRATRPKVTAGVVVVDLRENGVLRWTDEGRPGRTELFGPFRTTSMTFTCPDGRAAESLPVSPANPGPRTRDEMRAARRRACSR